MEKKTIKKLNARSQSLHQQIRATVVHLCCGSDHHSYYHNLICGGGGPGGCLDSWSNLHLLIAIVKDTVVLTHEDVTHDPERSSWGRHVDAHESKQALARGLDDIVLGFQREGVTSKRDIKI